MLLWRTHLRHLGHLSVTAAPVAAERRACAGDSASTAGLSLNWRMPLV
jgi:hypothetical protein